MKLLKKEFRLCMHPFCYILPLLSSLVLVPAYPYGVCCFYTALGIFFICLSARENHDASYTLTLPVSRREAAAGRICLCVCLEMIQLLCMGLFILLKNAVIPGSNPAGLDAGLAVIGEGFLLYTLFNLVFFPRYWRDISKPGVAFVIASVVLFLWIILEIVATYAVPFVRDTLDTPDPEHLREKAVFTLCAAALFAAGSFLSARLSGKRFESVDLKL